MIQFVCAECGKHLAQPENCCGMLVFCDQCGHGNRVPWESTVLSPEPVESLPEVLPIEPLPPVSVASPQPPAESPPPVSPLPAAPQRRRGPDPRFCLNHPEIPAEVACAECQERFCSHCVLDWNGRKVCGPCKNYYFWQRSRPSRRSPLALAACFLSLGVGTILGLWTLHHLERFTQLSIVFAIQLAPQLLAALLALWALRRSWHCPQPVGQSLALTALIAALANSLLLALLTGLRLVEWL